MRILRVLPLLLLASTLRAADTEIPPDFDAARLRTGTFHYRTMVDEKEAGKSRIQIRKFRSGDYVFTNVVEGAFSQSWEAVATRAFVPLSARLMTGTGKSARSVFELAYHGGRVKGFAVSGKDGSPARRNVDDAIGDDTVDQRIDWAAVMAERECPPGCRFRFHVYDPGTGLSSVTARVLGLETTTVPAGTFPTVRISYRIEKAKGAESYVVLVKKDEPRFLVQEMFPNGAVTELVEIGK